MKWAQTEDGFIAPLSRNEQKPVWITNEVSRQLAHKWRAEEHAILVGTNTVLQDNPSLTVRHWTGHNPIRIVLDRNQKISQEYKVFNAEAETIVVTKNDIDFNGKVASQVCALLHKNDIQSLIIEGGSKTLQTFIDEDLWDEARVFTGKMLFKKGIEAPKFTGELISEELIVNDTLKVYVQV